MTTVIDKVKNLIDIRLGSFKEDHSTIDQAMVDCAVILMSHMRPDEIENALYMSLGHEGVADLVRSRINDMKSVNGDSYGSEAQTNYPRTP